MLRVVTFNVGHAGGGGEGVLHALRNATDIAAAEGSAQPGGASSGSTPPHQRCCVLVVLQEVTAAWERRLRGDAALRRRLPHVVFKRCELQPPWAGGAALMCSHALTVTPAVASPGAAPAKGASSPLPRSAAEVTAPHEWQPPAAPGGWYHTLLSGVCISLGGGEALRVAVAGVHLRPPTNTEGVPTPLAAAEARVARKHEAEAAVAGLRALSRAVGDGGAGSRAAPCAMVLAGDLNEGPFGGVAAALGDASLSSALQASAVLGATTWHWPLSRLCVGRGRLRAAARRVLDAWGVGPSDARDDVYVSPELVVVDAGVAPPVAPTTPSTPPESGGADSKSDGAAEGDGGAAQAALELPPTHRLVWAVLRPATASERQAAPPRRAARGAASCWHTVASVLQCALLLLLLAGVLVGLYFGHQSAAARRAQQHAQLHAREL